MNVWGVGYRLIEGPTAGAGELRTGHGLRVAEAPRAPEAVPTRVAA